jgi:hypothetical protein
MHADPAKTKNASDILTERGPGWTGEIAKAISKTTPYATLWSFSALEFIPESHFLLSRDVWKAVQKSPHNIQFPDYLTAVFSDPWGRRRFITPATSRITRSISALAATAATIRSKYRTGFHSSGWDSSIGGQV